MTGEICHQSRRGQGGRLPLSPFALEQKSILDYSISGSIFSARVRETMAGDLGSAV